MKKEKGITLVALVTSIIVLLILATVSIQVLTGDNGLLTKSESAVDKYSEGEVCEQIKLAYLECKTEKLYNSNVDDVEFLTNSLKEKLNDNNLTVKVKNGKVTVNMTVKGEPKTYKYNSSTGRAFLDIINYGNKTEETVNAGDDIFIGTEKFRVFYNKDGVIKAMPFFNLKLDSSPMRQATQEEADNEQEGTNTFSSRKYWSGTDGGADDTIDINMTAEENYIQQFIVEYEKTLESIGAMEITVRACKKQDLGSELSDMLSNIQKRNIANPSQKGVFFLGSAQYSNNSRVYVVNNAGNIVNYYYHYSSQGVRPIIIIEY